MVIVCLATFLAVQALHDDAFETEFSSFNDIFQSAKFENVDYIRLKWKSTINKEPMFTVTYEKYWDLWSQVWRVAGNRGPIRPYALSVGGENKIDGTYYAFNKFRLNNKSVLGILTDAVRNHILGHNTKTFNNSYQARDVGANLIALVFEGDPNQARSLH